MRSEHTTKIDFDTWAEMAKNDPDAFERMRLQAIDEFIESVPESSQERLRRFQWRIDQERRLAKTPLAACIRLSSMMWQSLLGDGGLRDRFATLANTTATLYGGPASTVASKPKLAPTAEILSFKQATTRV